MKSKKVVLALVILFILYSVYIFLGVKSVPFHPDESSLLYQSRDLEKAISEPAALFWSDTPTNAYDQTYRLLNAPLAKYIIGIGRLGAGYGAESVSVDWDWGQSWDENAQQGALPPERLLLGSRLAVALFLPMSIILIYIAAQSIGGVTNGILAALLLALNTLVLLHTRRAMAEGVLLFGVCLAIVGVLYADRRPWLDGLGMGLAISAKYSALALLPAGLVAVLWGSSLDRRQILKKLSIFILTFSLVVIVLHPLLWRSPVRAVKEMVHARTDFISSQVTTLQAHNPEQLLDSPGKKLGVMLYTVFLGAPQFEEVGNYSSILADEIDAYLNTFGNNLLGGPIWGGILLFFTLLGVIVGVSKARDKDSEHQRRGIILLIFMSVCQAGALLILNPLPYQRYYLPLIPFVCLWAALGISTSSTIIKKAVQRSNGSSNLL